MLFRSTIGIVPACFIFHMNLEIVFPAPQRGRSVGRSHSGWFGYIFAWSDWARRRAGSRVSSHDESGQLGWLYG